jgi:hypothetical protein
VGLLVISHVGIVKAVWSWYWCYVNDLTEILLISCNSIDGRNDMMFFFFFYLFFKLSLTFITTPLPSVVSFFPESYNVYLKEKAGNKNHIIKSSYN